MRSRRKHCQCTRRKKQKQKAGFFRNKCGKNEYNNNYETYKKNCCQKWKYLSSTRKHRCTTRPEYEFDEPIKPIKYDMNMFLTNKK